MDQLRKRIYRGGVKVLALSTAVAAGVAYYDYKSARDVDKDSPKQKKKTVLVLPFHRMKLVESKRKFGFSSSLPTDFDDEDGGTIEVEVKELVEIIHAAAQDPNIVALYGKFGHGFGFSAQGWAQVQEVRNALRVFKECHRVHWEPNRDDKSTPTRRGTTPKKHMYAYADTFANPVDPANKEYYLASVFPRLHLQHQGELNLFGFSMSYPFLRGALDKYGIKVHVFKHGKYKNAPNMFTERGFVHDHLENTKELVEAMNEHICDALVHSRRGLASLNDMWVWDILHNYGTFAAPLAARVGLVDYLPNVDPLDVLLSANKMSPEEAEKVQKKWSTKTDFGRFEAVEAVSFPKYSAICKKRKMLAGRKLRHYARLRNLAEKYNSVKAILSVVGYGWPYGNIKEEDCVTGMSTLTKEKIAIVRVGGKITDSVARKTVNSLKKIKDDKKVKCVILRVDSTGGSPTAAETILQGLNEIPQPSICSMGNVAASAGYYIASNCEKIYALPTTITGSIGVFGLKVDLTGMASQYGVKVQHVVAGPFSLSNSLFQPMTKPIKENFSASVDRMYDCFKSRVADGRDMSLDEVEAVAQGRVFTGDQARDAGLVDELGDLTRAIGYANQNYTSGYAQVEVWPKKPSLMEDFSKLVSDEDTDSDSALRLFHAVGKLAAYFSQSDKKEPSAVSDSDMTKHFLSGLIGHSGLFDNALESRPLSSSLSGIMMTMDETEAIRCLLQDYSEKREERP